MPEPGLDEAQLARGERVREALVEALEQSYQNEGVWPEALPEVGPDVTYTRPEPVADAELARELASITVVLHESLERHPEGVWVGYADGHLEFAPDAARLEDCKRQVDLAREILAAHGSVGRYSPNEATTPPPGGPSGELTLRILDPEGRPVEGALVGLFGVTGDQFLDDPRAYFSDGQELFPLKSDAGGEVTVPAGHVFWARFAKEPEVALLVIHETRGLVAHVMVQQSEFRSGDKVQQVRLHPGHKVTGELTSVGLRGAGQSITWTGASAAVPNRRRLTSGLEQSFFGGPRFEFFLPPGDHRLDVWTGDTERVHRYVRIEPGQEDLHLQIDLPPSTIARLIGRPAPELRQIRGWKNGEPTTLADLRGKVVILEFWGTWCGPCLEAMPALMQLHDEFADDGVVIIAIHDDSGKSMEEIERDLERIRHEPMFGWNGRELPFLIALDGGGETRITGTSRTSRGATTAAYGIPSFPTTLLIGPDGKVVDKIHVRRVEALDEARAQIKQLLEAAGEPSE